ncbi:hypothetical protein HMPREF1141_1722 [Clostridium sp. MSTE9]|nr:hypothetical protein HMPREF1141_1722 [Clostridium sp. MSTE9]
MIPFPFIKQGLENILYRQIECLKTRYFPFGMIPCFSLPKNGLPPVIQNLIIYYNTDNFILISIFIY